MTSERFQRLHVCLVKGRAALCLQRVKVFFFLIKSDFIPKT